jgi:hypothetical protein
MILGLIKHDALPVLEDDGWEPTEGESESEDEEAAWEDDDGEEI